MLFYDDDTRMLFLAMKVLLVILYWLLLTSHIILHMRLLFSRVNQQFLSSNSWTNPLTSVKVCSTFMLKITFISLLIVGSDICRCPSQTKGLAMVPKRAVDVMACQVTRFMQLTQTAIVPIGYYVQRKVPNSLT